MVVVVGEGGGMAVNLWWLFVASQTAKGKTKVFS